MYVYFKTILYDQCWLVGKLRRIGGKARNSGRAGNVRRSEERQQKEGKGRKRKEE